MTFRLQLQPAQLGAILAFLLLAGLVYHFGVDVLVLDQWSLVEDVEKSYTGELTTADLLSPHNGHRIAVPRLILVYLARLTGWNTRFEMALTLLLAIGIYLTFMRQGASLLRRYDVEPGWFLFTAMAIAVFSLNQWESWLWGIMMHVYLQLLAAALGFVLLTRPVLGLAAFCGAVALGVVATLSQGAGLVYWGIGALVLVVRWRRSGYYGKKVDHNRKGTRGNQRTGWPMLRLGLWLVIAAVIGGLYLVGLEDNAQATETSSYVIAHPLQGLYFTFSFLGAPVVSFAGASHPPKDVGAGLAAGLLGVGLLVYLGFLLCRRLRVAPKDLLFFYALALHAAGAAALTAIARTHRGLEKSFASRYMTLSTPLWIGVLVLSLLAYRLAARQGVLRARRGRLALRAAPLFLIVLMVASSLYGLPRFKTRKDTLDLGRTALRYGEPESLMEFLHPNVRMIKRTVGVLRERRLSVFREDVEIPALPTVPAALGSFGQIITLDSELGPMRAGKETTVAVRVKNPTLETWPAQGEALGVFAVRLSYHWRDSAGRTVEHEGLRTPLPHDLGPGASITLRATIRAPTQPGSYRLLLTMVQEGVRWFYSAGATPLEVRVDVGE